MMSHKEAPSFLNLILEPNSIQGMRQQIHPSEFEPMPRSHTPSPLRENGRRFRPDFPIPKGFSESPEQLHATFNTAGSAFTVSQLVFVIVSNVKNEF
jgi:hypothetical protein